MPIPKKLVLTAAEDIATWLRVHAHEDWSANQESVQLLAYKVLTTALAALPDYESIVMAIAKEMPHGYGLDRGVLNRDYDKAKGYLTALANSVQS